MTAASPSREVLPPGRRGHLGLILLGLVSWAVYAAIAGLSWRFATPENPDARPILAVLGLFALAFACYWGAIAVAVRDRDSRRLVGWIVVGSVIFRLTLLWSWPIQEVDFYRYLWDGAVVTEGVSPFRYSPQQALAATSQEGLPEDLGRLVELRQRSPVLAGVLKRVHYPELSTVYPPVSQAVFAAAAGVSPEESGVIVRLVFLKTLLVLFDLGTLMLVIGLVRIAGLHSGWALAYGWCPLLMKEVANTGHLDAAAVFLTILAVFVTARAVLCSPATGSKRSATVWTSVSAGVLALAVGAKLYPIVLVPLFAAAWIRGLGWRRAAVPTVVLTATVAGVLWPMVPSGQIGPDPSEATAGVPVEVPSSGLRAFFGRWEINDLLFMVVVENVRPPGATPPEKRPWFAVAPVAWRVGLLERLRGWLPGDVAAAAFLAARAVTGGLFLLLALGLAWWGSRRGDLHLWLRAAFLTLAWFWLLSPTQNPWYWTWALPLVVFARSRAWLAVSGLAMVYYLRFWLAYHWPEEPVPGTGYPGTLFFDFVVPWLEFGPWFAWLAIDAWRLGRSDKGPAPEPSWRSQTGGPDAVHNTSGNVIEAEAGAFGREPSGP